MKTSRLLLCLAACAFLALPGCSDDTEDLPDLGPGTDAGLDAAADSGGDGAVKDGAGDGSTTTGDAPKRTKCSNSAIPAPSGGTCSVTKGSGSAVLLRGTVLGPDEVFENGHLLISGGKIACVGCDCSSESGYKDATVVACQKGVISPGLINAHDHVGWTVNQPVPTTNRYDHRHEWRKGLNGKPKISSGSSNYSKEALAWGEMRMVIGGATSIMGASSSTSQNGLLRNLDAHNEGLSSGRVYDSTFPLGDSSGTMCKNSCSCYKLPSSSAAGGPSAYVPHVSEGGREEARNEFLCLSGLNSSGVDVATKYSAFIHSVGLSLTEILDMATSGTMAIWSPRTNISLYGYTADVVLMHNLGVGIALGTDWIPSGSMNMLRELTCARYLNQKHYNNFFKDYHLWAMATANAADAFQVGQEIGRLKKGYFADIAVFDGSALTASAWPHTAVVNSDVTKVALVMRGGKVLYGESALVKALDAGGGSGCDALDSCLKDRLACFNDANQTMAGIKQKVSNPYPLYFCGTVTKEPSCKPMRPNEYPKTGITDADGDGIEDSKDNCPKVFNPIRLMDSGKQPDTDGDKIGDVCDVCPLDTENKKPCKSSPSPDDRDADGVPDKTDNCPLKANKDQKDSDNDKIGDACDPCPNSPNPGGTACPFTIKMLRDKSLGKKPSDGTKVKLVKVVVTSLPGSSSTTKGFYLREGTAAYEGLYVYTGQSSPQKATNGTALKVGDEITIEASFKEWNNIDELEKVTSIVVTGSGKAAAAIAVKTKDLQPGSSSAEGYESHLVKVQSAKVAVASSSSDDNFYVADDGNACSGTKPPCTQVGDFYFDGGKTDGKPKGTAGQTCTITGIVNGYKNDHALEPATLSDLSCS